jgi:hypothetical protein
LHAQSLVHEARLGILAHDVPDLWSGFRLERGGVDINGELVLRPALALFGGMVRPVIGGTVHTGGGTSKGYIDARWQWDAPLTSAGGLFIGLGVGAAIHNGETQPIDPKAKALGRRVLFHFPAEIGWRFDQKNSLSLYFEHISNGYTAKPNEGLDSLGIRYGYRF